jgi:hypothetical protein
LGWGIGYFLNLKTKTMKKLIIEWLEKLKLEYEAPNQNEDSHNVGAVEAINKMINFISIQYDFSRTRSGQNLIEEVLILLESDNEFPKDSNIVRRIKQMDRI